MDGGGGVHQTGLKRIAPPENAQMANNISHALALPDNDFEMLTPGLRLERSGIHFHQAAIGGHADNVKRLVELMRHAGGHLSEGGKFRGLNQLRFDLLLITDVIDDRKKMRYLAVATANDAGHGAAPKGASVGAPQLNFALRRAILIRFGKDLFVILRWRRVALPGEQIVADIVFAVYAGDVADTRIDIFHRAVWVRDQHRIGALRDGARQFVQLVLRFLALGNVERHGDHIAYAAILIAERRFGGEQRAGDAAAIVEAFLDRCDRLATLKDLPVDLLTAAAELLPHQVADGLADRVVRFNAKCFCELAVNEFKF